MRPVTVEIVAYAPTEFFHCLHCEFIWRETGVGPKIHAEQRASALPPPLAEEYARLGSWACEIQERFGSRVELRVTDVVSLEGFFKVIRHQLRHLPSVIVSGRHVYSAGSLEGVAAAIERELGATGATAPGTEADTSQGAGLSF